jgi:hypothetical protein
MLFFRAEENFYVNETRRQENVASLTFVRVIGKPPFLRHRTDKHKFLLMLCIWRVEFPTRQSS